MSGGTLWALVGPTGSRPALVVPGEAPLGAARLREAVERLAGRLAAAGIGRGDRVAFVVPNGPEFVELLLAVTALGAAAAPLNPAYTRDEFTFYVDDIKPQLLLVPAGDFAAAREAAAGLQVVDVVSRPADAPALVAGGRELEREAPFVSAAPDDVALVLHTSGTTGPPKQVPLLQRNLTASVRTIVESYRLAEDDVSFCAMPLFHVHGLVASTLAALAAGAPVVLPRRFSPRRFWAQAREHRVAWLSAGPTLHQMILEKIDPAGPPATLRFTRSCSSALSPALLERAESAYGVPVLEAYGMTEASHQMASNPLPPGQRVAGSVGMPTGCEIRIVDAAGADVEVGEVVIRGPNVMPGYFANEAANAESFVDGWFRTGDRGRFADGYLRLEGRLKEMILRGGENVSPYEIEEVLLAHPAVSDAVTYGVEDERYGELVEAAVTLRADVDERRLLDHCRERLAAFKVPERIRIVDAIPRTPTGKLQRRRVAALLDEANV
jgi:acyl-CoA synthetase (AMP-forming)/AMP-acid ligase II